MYGNNPVNGAYHAYRYADDYLVVGLRMCCT